MGRLIQLVVNQPKLIKHCGNCKYRKGKNCLATGESTYNSIHWQWLCGLDYSRWERRLPRVEGVLERVWKWLFGGYDE